MKKNLEKFVKENREAFDEFEPSPQVWSQIQKKIKKEEKPPKGVVISMRVLRWSAAAAIIGMVGLITFNYLNTGKPAVVDPIIASKESSGPNNNPSGITTAKDETSTATQPIEQMVTGSTKKETGNASINYAAQINDYSKQIATQTSSLKKISVGSPGLYEQFNIDLKKLQDNYEYLSSQLGTHPNQDKLLTAMVQNLQLQSELLKRQIQVAKKINNEKKKNYEQATQSL